MNELSKTLLSVHWIVPIGVYILAAYVGVRTLGKYLANMPNQITKVSIIQGLCAFASIAFAAFAFGAETLTQQFALGALAVAPFGVANGLANITQWKANRVSMSQTSLLSFGDDVIAIGLAMWLVNDVQYVNERTGIGMALCLTAAVLFWLHGRERDKHESNRFFMLVLTYSVLWGVADFALRYFAVQKLHVAQFLTGWYVASFLTVFTVYAVTKLRGEMEAPMQRLTMSEITYTALFAAGIITCLAIEYWARWLAPQTAVQPTLLIAEAVVPTIIGLTVFREGMKWDAEQYVYAALGVSGVALIAFGMR